MQYTIAGISASQNAAKLVEQEAAYRNEEISEEKLLETAWQLFEQQTAWLQEAGVAYIPADFSLYDPVTDLCFRIGALPESLKNDSRSSLAKYFALAEGFHDEKRQWHEGLEKIRQVGLPFTLSAANFARDMKLAFQRDVAWPDFLAQEKTDLSLRPVVPGPYSLLRLASFEGARQDYLPDFLQAYADLLKEAEKSGAQWLTFDEPELGSFISKEELQRLNQLYRPLLKARGSLKIMVQTRAENLAEEIYQALRRLPFAGYGLNFTGTGNLRLLEKQGFPRTKTLFAGVVDSRNVWRTSYSAALETIGRLKEITSRLVLNTTFSLQYVPWSVEAETGLPKYVRDQLAFAKEKIEELAELARLAELEDPTADPAYRKNRTMRIRRPRQGELSALQRLDLDELFEETDENRLADYETMREHLENMQSEPEEQIAEDAPYGGANLFSQLKNVYALKKNPIRVQGMHTAVPVLFWEVPDFKQRPKASDTESLLRLYHTLRYSYALPQTSLRELDEQLLRLGIRALNADYYAFEGD